MKKEKVEIIKSPAKASNSASGFLKKNAWMSIFESLLMLVLGILLVVFADSIIRIIAYIVGGFLLVKGGYRIINYYMSNGQKDFLNNELLWGIISAIIGIVILVMGEGIANAFRIVAGIWIIYEALVRINTAVKMHSNKITSWRYCMIFALVMLVFGMFITFFEGAVIALIGWMMIVAGIIGIMSDAIFMQYLGLIMQKISNKE